MGMLAMMTQEMLVTPLPIGLCSPTLQMLPPMGRQT
jgi:hypothetical protein